MGFSHYFLSWDILSFNIILIHCQVDFDKLSRKNLFGNMGRNTETSVSNCQMRKPTIISNEGVTKILVCRCRRGGGIDFGGWWYVCPRYSDTTTLWQAHIGGFSDMTRRSDIQQQQEQLYRKDRLEGKHAE